MTTIVSGWEIRPIFENEKQIRTSEDHLCLLNFEKSQYLTVTRLEESLELGNNGRQKDVVYIIPRADLEGHA